MPALLKGASAMAAAQASVEDWRMTVARTRWRAWRILVHQRLVMLEMASEPARMVTTRSPASKAFLAMTPMTPPLMQATTMEVKATLTSSCR